MRFSGWNIRRKGAVCPNCMIGVAVLVGYLMSACVSSPSQMSRFYRDCSGRISYVMCPGAPSWYHSNDLKKDGSLAKLNDKETKAMSIFLGEGDTRSKVEQLKALGYSSTRGVDFLEFLLCSQYASCALTREQYADFRHTILPVVENN